MQSRKCFYCNICNGMTMMMINYRLQCFFSVKDRCLRFARFVVSNPIRISSVQSGRADSRVNGTHVEIWLNFIVRAVTHEKASPAVHYKTPGKERDGQELLHSALLDSNLRKPLQWESSSTWIPRCHFQQKTVQWCCQVLLRHLLCIQTFCGPRRLFPCLPLYSRRSPRTRVSWWRTCCGSADLPPSCTGASRLQAHLLRPLEPQLWTTPAQSTSPCLHLSQKDQALHKHQFQTIQITWSLEWMRFSRQQHETVGFSFVYKLATLYCW